MDTIQDSKRLPRRRHDAALKRQVLAECAKPEASVASIALAYGLNANPVHKWRRMAEVPSARQATERLTPAHSFIALPLTASQPTPAQELVIELRRGALTVKVSWPVAAASECAAWMRELLR
ncbi:transposase [Variovorax sp. PAMC26660]|uniref:transposase n=1 Tax=Variovorax sp. PAMC26660 TaxID=2762322 RepID=UPI0021C36130|nr:transposase [Variovorax sp. PAMC26660]